RIAAEFRARERTEQGDDAPVLARVRREELDLNSADRAIQTGTDRVTIGPVQQLQVAAIRVDRIKMYRAAARVLPAAEHDAAVGEHVRVHVVALVERDLADTGA